MRYSNFLVYCFLVITACSPSMSEQPNSPLQINAHAEYGVCDADPPDGLRRLSLRNLEPESVRACLIASANAGDKPEAFGVARGGVDACSTFTSRHPFQVRSGLAMTLEISSSYERQKTLEEHPNLGNRSFWTFALVGGDAAENCVLAPWLSSDVPYVALEDEEGELISVLVYFPQTTERYLAEFGIDIEFDAETAAIDFYELVARQ